MRLISTETRGWTGRAEPQILNDLSISLMSLASASKSVSPVVD